MSRRIAVITGSRGEWGYIRPVLRLIDQDPEVDYHLIVTNMHLLPEFGLSVREIEGDGFRVAEKIYMTFDGYTGATMVKSLAVFLMELPTVLSRIKPDLVLLAGDRGEQLMAAVAGGHLQIPVAHIQAGEVSGNIDGVVRHSITKLAHIHFAANQEFANRVIKLGEQAFRVHVTGAPLVDELIAGAVTSTDELVERYRLDPTRPLILAVQHPVTEEEEDAGAQIEQTLLALGDMDCQTALVYPNADAGSHAIRTQLSRLSRGKVRFFRNLPRADYLAMMKMAAAMVGNSSSGVMEAPSFGTPAVNIGRRQIGRPQASNVINVGYDRHEIVAAIQRAVSPAFRQIARSATNPYGDGKASQRIVEILKTIDIDDRLLRKEMTY